MLFKSKFIIFLFLFSIINLKTYASGKSSFELIEDDLLTNKITSSQAVLYRALALRGDSSLPSQYVGDPTAAVNRDQYPDSLITEVQDVMSDLSLEDSLLALRLVSPPSYVPERKPGVSNLTNDDELPTPVPGVNWDYLDILEARIWFKNTDPRASAFAETAAVNFPKILQKLKEISNHSPISDNGESYKITLKDGREVTLGNGGNGKIDIYIMPFETSANTYAYFQSYKGSYTKDPTPGFIVINSTLNKDNREFNSTLMHETMHLIQYTYPKKQVHRAYSKIGEGVATWSENYWDNSSQFEHPYNDFFVDGRKSLKEASYGTWTFYYFLEKTYGFKIIEKLYEMMGNFNSYEAIDKTLNGGLKKNWPEYTRKEWNQYPPDDDNGFKKWDDFSDVPHEPNGKEVKTKNVIIDTSIGDYVFSKPVSLRPLTRAYFDFEFTRPDDTHSVSIGMTHFWKKSKVTLKALIETEEGWRVEQWDNQYEDKQICFDKKSDRIKRMVLIYSNFDFRDGVAPSEFEVNVSATNLGCLGYKGSAISTFSSRTSTGTVEMQVNSNAEYRAKDSIISDPTSGPHFPGQYYLKTVSGTFTYRATDAKNCVGNLATSFQISNEQAKDKGVIGLYPYNNHTANNYRTYSMSIGHPNNKSYPVQFICPNPQDNYTVGVVMSPLETGVQTSDPQSENLSGTYIYDNGNSRSKFNFQPIIE